MKRIKLLTRVGAVGWLTLLTLVTMSLAADSQSRRSKDLDTPAVFQAAGPTIDSIKGTLDEFRMENRTGTVSHRVQFDVLPMSGAELREFIGHEVRTARRRAGSLGATLHS